MKNRLYACVGLLMCTAVGMAQEMTFKEVVHDFGSIEEQNGEVSYDFEFTNTGDKDLIIKDVITGCGCTSAKWKATPYAPGAKGVVRVSYRPEERKMTQFSIPTEVFTNLKEPYTLTVTGKVDLMHRSYINYFDPANGDKAEYKEKKAADDFELILQRVRDGLYAKYTVEQIDKNATSLMKLMNAKGMWPQIDYGCRFRTNWEPVDHLSRIERLAIAYTCPQSTLYGNDVLYSSIEKAVKLWNKMKPKSFNWWYNEISAPKSMGNILALMEAGVERLPQKDVQALMQMMAESDPRKWTGANKMDIAAHHIIRGCVLKNDSIVDTAVSEFYQPIRISDEEGIKPDLSYQQHGKQLYIGGYGYVFIENVSKVVPLFIGTKYALDQERLNIFNEFVRKSYLNVFRAGYIDFSVCGRSITRAKTLDLSNTTEMFQRMKALDPEHAQEYEDAIQRFTTKNAALGRKDQNKMYWLSDYMVHNRKRFDITVRAVSKRTCRSESGNGENLWGTFVSEGATNIRISGDEYLDIFPVWEWDKIPGTTTPTGEVENHNDWGVAGVADFVGGVSDGRYGVMSYAMNDYGMQAHKGWFMFDNEVVCLGAGINGGEGKEVHTTLNQCHLVGNVFGFDGEKLFRFADNGHLATDFKGWIWHNKVGYYLPDTTAVVLKNGMQTGKWSKINFNQSGAEVSKPVFNLIASHGVNPTEAKYAYIVVPGVVSPASLRIYNTQNIVIASNTKALQAVMNKQLDQLQAIFYEKGTLTLDGLTLQAEKPCVVMVKGCSTAQPEVLAKDPTQTAEIVIGKDVKVMK